MLSTVCFRRCAFDGVLSTVCFRRCAFDGVYNVLVFNRLRMRGRVVSEFEGVVSQQHVCDRPESYHLAFDVDFTICFLEDELAALHDSWVDFDADEPEYYERLSAYSAVVETIVQLKVHRASGYFSRDAC